MPLSLSTLFYHNRLYSGPKKNLFPFVLKAVVTFFFKKKKKCVLEGSIAVWVESYALKEAKLDHAEGGEWGYNKAGFCGFILQGSGDFRLYCHFKNLKYVCIY